MFEANEERFFEHDDYLNQIRQEKEELRKERIKIQTANVERNRIDRDISRQELYYEQIGLLCQALPLPDFQPLFIEDVEYKKNYLLCISDLHYGAKFISENNEYSPDIARERLEFLTSRLYDFVREKHISHINIACLGDVIQGILRVSDLKLNDTTVVKSIVEISRLLALFLNCVSGFVEIDYYHVPSSNHTQMRPLGTKASQIAEEDFEYVVGNYIKDLCANNQRIHVHLAEDNKNYIEIDIEGYSVLAMHGHQIRNVDTALRDISQVKQEMIDYLILGHLHTNKLIPSGEGCCHDTEVFVCPSFVGSDPYSDSLMKGSKASVKIFGFDEVYGCDETYKIILN